MDRQDIGTGRVMLFMAKQSEPGIFFAGSGSDSSGPLPDWEEVMLT